MQQTHVSNHWVVPLQQIQRFRSITVPPKWHEGWASHPSTRLGICIEFQSALRILGPHLWIPPLADLWHDSRYSQNPHISGPMQCRSELLKGQSQFLKFLTGRGLTSIWSYGYILLNLRMKLAIIKIHPRDNPEINQPDIDPWLQCCFQIKNASASQLEILLLLPWVLMFCYQRFYLESHIYLTQILIQIYWGLKHFFQLHVTEIYLKLALTQKKIDWLSSAESPE